MNQHHIAVTRLRPGQRTQLHTHDFCEVFLVEEGRGQHLWNGRELPLQPGSVALIRAEDAHAYQAERGSTLAFINLAVPQPVWTAFELLLREKATEPVHWTGDPAGHRHLDEAGARTCAAAMHDLLERGGAEPQLLPVALTAVASQLLRASVHAQATPGAPDWLEAWRRSLYEPDLLSRPIGWWQKRAGVSAAHLSRSCRKFYGAPPTELLNRARIEWVQRRLRAGEHKGVELALDAGFENLGFFYRCFKRYAGSTPRQWLRKQGGAVPGG
ncbi:helix-turn-helix domain-containing protein [Nibricoccus sp. IMCC34717]|uniref:helix-turn-helix domain-containing protein n=1 Tax=Nibricoccus sp. IMCC34717 TaxID=3034021 RepID=UPI00384E42AB